MGQKTNPNGMRIGVNKGWNSTWYAPKLQFAKLLHEDLKLRAFVDQQLQPAGVSKIKIKRSMNKILLEIAVARPGVVIGKGGTGIDALKASLKRMVKSEVELKVFEVKNPEIMSKLIAENIKSQLIRRIVPKFASIREIENAKNSGKVKGIRIWVSGRIKGAEIARTEKFQWGTVPLATLRANIDYCFLDAQVPNAGKHGIKIWVYKGEKSNMDETEV